MPRVAVAIVTLYSTNGKGRSIYDIIFLGGWVEGKPKDDVCYVQ